VKEGSKKKFYKNFQPLGIVADFFFMFSFGAVYKGEWKGKAVAVKKLAANAIGTNVSDFFREASLFLSIGAHPNVIKLYGICQELRNYSMVMEFVPNGSLDRLLADPTRQISDEERFNWIRGIAAGLAHLASKNIIHRDIATRNVLLDDVLNPRISGTSA
jgi:serine/threonine protein kinase